MINTFRLTPGRIVRSIVVPVIVALALVWLSVMSASASEIGINRINDRVSRYFVRDLTPSFSAFTVDKVAKPTVAAEPVLAAIQAAEEEAARIAAEEAARAAEEARQAAARAASPAVASGGAISGAPCAAGSAIEAGLTANAINVYRAVCGNFPVSGYGGNRGTPDEHGAGLAIDFMISGDAGWALANYLVANAGSLRINYVIYAQQINLVGLGGGWRPMEDRGSITQNHYDHVHVTVY